MPEAVQKQINELIYICKDHKDKTISDKSIFSCGTKTIADELIAIHQDLDAVKSGSRKWIAVSILLSISLIWLLVFTPIYFVDSDINKLIVIYIFEIVILFSFNGMSIGSFKLEPLNLSFGRIMAISSVLTLIVIGMNVSTGKAKISDLTNFYNKTFNTPKEKALN